MFTRSSKGERTPAGTSCTADSVPLDRGQTLTEISVSALTSEPDLRDIGRALIALTRYHAARVPSEAQL